MTRSAAANQAFAMSQREHWLTCWVVETDSGFDVVKAQQHPQNAVLGYFRGGKA